MNVTTSKNHWANSHIIWRHVPILQTPHESVLDVHLVSRFHCHKFYALAVINGGKDRTLQVETEKFQAEKS